MSNQEVLERLKQLYVDPVEYWVYESERDTKKSSLEGMTTAQLEATEDELWKQVTHIDEHRDAIRRKIKEVTYYDDEDLSQLKKIGMILALIEYDNLITAAREKLTDKIIRNVNEFRMSK